MSGWGTVLRAFAIEPQLGAELREVKLRPGHREAVRLGEAALSTKGVAIGQSCCW